MSESLLEFDRWPTGIAQATIPANNNARRAEALAGPAISATTTAQPGSPAELDIYIIPAGATGAQWGGFDEDDVAIYYEATWTAFAPFEGLRKFVQDEGIDWQFIGDSSGGWTATGGGAGDVVGPASSTNNYVALFDGITGKLLKSGGPLPSGAWGSITGTLSAQTDLQAELDAKAPLSITQNSKSAAYTLVLSDAGKHIYHPSADTTARIWTIPANSSVAFPIGTVVTFVNDNAAGVITIAITTDTMRLAGAGTTGSRTLAANGIATAIKMTSTSWQINGTGLT